MKTIWGGTMIEYQCIRCKKYSIHNLSVALIVEASY